MSLLLSAAGIVLLGAGATMILRGRTGRVRITRELSDQKIIFPVAGDLPAPLTRFAGVHVRTGAEALAFSDLIGGHVTRATAGRTYAEIAEECQANGRGDERLNRLRETAFVGQSLRGSLLGAYQAWEITTLVIGLGGLFATIGMVFLALAATWH